MATCYIMYNTKYSMLVVFQLKSNSCKVKLTVSHHTLADNSVRSEKPLVFVMDNKRPEDEEKGTKKRKRGENKSKPGPNFKNFGSCLQTTKIKGSSKLVIGWRARCANQFWLFHCSM